MPWRNLDWIDTANPRKGNEKLCQPKDTGAMATAMWRAWPRSSGPWRDKARTTRQKKARPEEAWLGDRLTPWRRTTERRASALSVPWRKQQGSDAYSKRSSCHEPAVSGV